MSHKNDTNEVRELKPAKTYEEQVNILKCRGLYIDDDATAIECLSALNYYRLRGYYIHLQNGDEFMPGVSLSQIVSIHSFDSELRLLLLRLLFDIEIIARTRIAYEIGHAWGPIGYKEEANYEKCNPKDFKDLMDRIQADTDNSKERFIRIHNEKYGHQFPIWVAVETMSFGDLSKLFSLIPPKHQTNIANEYLGLDRVLLRNWLKAFTLLRNICAHNGRIYARFFTDRIRIEKKLEKYIQKTIGSTFAISNKSLFAYLLALRRVSRPETWNYFLSELVSLFEKNASIIELKRIGFPNQWRSILLPK